MGGGGLLLLKGHPCTGKSSLAEALSGRLRCPLVDKDDARDPLEAALGGTEAAGALNGLSYDIMLRYAGRQLQRGLLCVVDCPLARLELFRRCQGVAEQCGCAGRVAVVECVAGDEAVWRRRVQARAAADAGTDRAHKPRSWEALRELIAGYAGAEQWTTEALAAGWMRDGFRDVSGGKNTPPGAVLHMRVDTSASDVEVLARDVLGGLRKNGWPVETT